MQKLIKEYIKDNKLDLEKIVIEYSSYLSTIIKNEYFNIKEEDKEEIISEVFFILWKNQEKLDKDKYLSSYISGVCRNLIKEYFRKINNETDISEYENILYDYDEKDLITENIKIIQIEKILSKMKNIDKEIFLDYYYKSKSLEDIAKEKNMSTFSIRQRLYRIRKKIRKEVK